MVKVGPAYILTPDILPIIAKEQVGAGGEIVLADSFNELAKTDAVYGRVIDGAYHDTGNPMAYLQSVIDVALQTEAYGERLRTFMEKKLRD